MKSLNITTPKDIDLEKHGLIEASAGTGKTYTLTRLVVRLILEQKLNLDQILVVTYTDKAAGEMKERLRELLEEAVESGKFLDRKLDSNAVKRLRAQTLSYDRAAIQTIHSFCLNTLQRYAFENSFHFELEQVDDLEPAFETMRSILEKDLPNDFGDSLESLIALSGFKKGDKHSDSWEKNILNLALSAHPDFSKIEPAEKINFHTILDETEEELYRLSQQVDFDTIADKIHGGSKKQISRYRMLATLLKQRASLIRIHREIDFNERFSNRFVASRNPTDTERHCIEALNILRDRISAIGPSFKKRITEMVRDQFKVLKTVRKQISFNDMLTRVEEGLRPENSLLKRALQKQFRVALVDEFQDTDPVQWSIFRTLFLESPDHRLFIIGDPKQAIYSFRGADIHTYYRAAQAISDDLQAAACYQLPTNWRSAPDAIKAGNAFFAEFFRHPPDSDPEMGWTGFNSVESPEKPRNRSTGSCGITRSEFDSGFSAEELRLEAARHIAAECLTLLNSGTRIQLEGEEEREVQPGDICILSRARTHAPLYEKELVKAGLPCTIYKKQGIYNSVEARHLSLLLSHLANPQDSDATRLALLTRFFTGDKATAPSTPEPNTPAGNFLAELQKLAENRRWGGLFRTLIHTSGTALRIYPEAEGPRQLTNLEHISQNLETAAVTGGFDIHRLNEHLKRLITNQADEKQDEGLHRIESEEPRILIMTTHSSKGLEFPFVFVTNLIEGTSNDTPWFTCHRDGIRVYDLLKQAENRSAHEHDEREESKRLLYVALTRGIFSTNLLYKAEKPLRDPTKSPKKYPFHKQCLLDAIETLPEIPQAITTGTRQDKTPKAGDGIALPDPLFDEPAGFNKDGYKKRRISQASFTSLSAHVNMEAEISYEETGRATDDPADRLETEPAPQESGITDPVPKGARTGNLLHYLLEHTTFVDAKAPLEKFTLENLKRVMDAMEAARVRPIAAFFTKPDGQTPTAEEMKEQTAVKICGILHAALNCTLSDRDGYDFRLCDIDEKNKMVEMEFHFSLNETEAAKITEDAEWFAKGFFTGFIDLVFRRNNRYYILDWKSNWMPEYTRAEMEDTMQHHNYHLQASIYAEALRRWLKTHDLPCGEEQFGGVFYLFLRGVTAKESDAGIYSIPDPDPFLKRKQT